MSVLGVEKDDLLPCVCEDFEVPHELSVPQGKQTTMFLIFHHAILADLSLIALLVLSAVRLSLS